jgi:hypothetical protein
MGSDSKENMGVLYVECFIFLVCRDENVLKLDGRDGWTLEKYYSSLNCIF